MSEQSCGELIPHVVGFAATVSVASLRWLAVAGDSISFFVSYQPCLDAHHSGL